jgi:hypothetical protein
MVWGLSLILAQNLKLRIIVSVVAALVAALHLAKPELKIDSITMVALVICAIPWTQPLIKSIELLGVKLELQELRDKVAEATGAAQSASRQAGLALASSTAPEPPLTHDALPPKVDQVESLAQEYNRLRDGPSGPARTAAMTDVVRRMIDVARHTQVFNSVEALHSKNRGMRLFGYAYLYARPDPKMLVPLIESVTIWEDKPFGQYWGLQSIERVLAQTGTLVPPDATAKLRAFAERIPVGTDRDYELRKLLRQIDKSAPAD